MYFQHFWEFCVSLFPYSYVFANSMLLDIMLSNKVIIKTDFSDIDLTFSKCSSSPLVVEIIFRFALDGIKTHMVFFSSGISLTGILL